MSETKELKLVKSKAAVERKSPEKLKMVDAHKLSNLILEHFTEKRLTYGKFAEWATKELGFPVTGAQVATRVKEFEVPHGDQIAPPDPSEFTAMLLKHETQLQELTERMLKMEAWVNSTFPSVSGKKMLAG